MVEVPVTALLRSQFIARRLYCPSSRKSDCGSSPFSGLHSKFSCTHNYTCNRRAFLKRSEEAERLIWRSCPSVHHLLINGAFYERNFMDFFNEEQSYSIQKSLRSVRGLNDYTLFIYINVLWWWDKCCATYCQSVYWLANDVILLLLRALPPRREDSLKWQYFLLNFILNSVFY
jgi:hypothetical protein